MEDQELDELRRLLLGPERRRLDELVRRLDASGLSAEELAEFLPEALHESVQRNPRDIATAIFPVLGPAIRKAIAEAMAGLVRSINSAVEHSLSPQGLKWRIESWRTGVPYPQVVIRHALVYRVEQVFLVHAETGLPLGHAALPDLAAADADLVSGMLTAIQDFVRDSFHAEPGGELRTFSVGELTVLVEQGPQAVIAAVVRGQAPDGLLAKLQSTLEAAHVRFVEELADFTGDAAPFAAVEPALAECLETVLQPKEAGRRHRVWLRWAVPLMLLVLVGAALGIRAGRRWNQALARLRAEPGLVLVNAERSWGRWQLSGLRDPLAAEPRVILAGLGVDSASVEARFEPYLSLDRDLVLRRARQALGLSAEMVASLRGDTLALTGPAPLGWVARIVGQGLPAGVSALDLSQVVPVLAPAWRGVVASLEARRALFEVGSAVVTPAAAIEIAAAAGEARRLIDGAEAPGYRIELELVGRSDRTGTDATNQALSTMRVDAVRRRLIAAGVPPQALRGTATSTSRPLTGRDAGETARLNRSVSFAVHVTAGPLDEAR